MILIDSHYNHNLFTTLPLKLEHMNHMYQACYNSNLSKDLLET